MRQFAISTKKSKKTGIFVQILLPTCPSQKDNINNLYLIQIQLIMYIIHHPEQKIKRDTLTGCLTLFYFILLQGFLCIRSLFPHPL